MKVEIWSDVACPFCYIGKRHFEKALSQFTEKEHIEIEWKSYLLDPEYVYDPENPVTETEYIAARKGISQDEARQREFPGMVESENIGIVCKHD